MKTGDVVICRASRGYWFTEGKQYTIEKFEPPYSDETTNGFTWPAYVHVKDDEGKIAVAHAHRFILKDAP